MSTACDVATGSSIAAPLVTKARKIRSGRWQEAMDGVAHAPASHTIFSLASVSPASIVYLNSWQRGVVPLPTALSSKPVL
jgi:hypothetical protein